MKIQLLSLSIASFANVLLAAGVNEESASRTWVSNDGRPIDGVFLRANTDAVVIRRSDGKELTVPLKFLSAADREFVAKLRTETASAEAPEEKVRQYLKYKLSNGSEKWPEDRKKRITDAMDRAVALYNKVGVFKKDLTANNSPGTPTADANYDGWINFGGSINARVALHEIGHTLGIGTHGNWQANIKDGKWTGKHALEQLREFDGKDAVLNADRMHFWPYGLNFDNESSKENDIRHVKMVLAMRKDMGID
ncbi:hypothetical protein [Luteolibacter luteus]|uniref:SLA1 homology domain-containing protein n=1 Tax=Luteolibacter luteus TaxID=2728835 RepID=A0A858RIS6_9BACT|nr:hypothetical protein [Luteolibacter luteus]QJE96398.1 hypothetical protein HHL09_11590 [Luteolibacter luteus]